MKSLDQAPVVDIFDLPPAGTVLTLSPAGEPTWRNPTGISGPEALPLRWSVPGSSVPS